MAIYHFSIFRKNQIYSGFTQTSSPILVPGAPLRTFLLSLGFVTSLVGSSLFVYSRGNAVLYFLVYVDDLIITKSDPSLVNTIIRQLDYKFSIKDLEALSYLYGVEVLATSTGFLLS